MEEIGKYLFETNNEPSMAVRNLEVSADEKHQAVLKWTWPQDGGVKLMLVFALEDEDDAGAAKLLKNRHEHTVVSRNLADNVLMPIQGERQRFLLCPAYFNEDNKVVVYGPEVVSDWVYKVSMVTARAVYKPLLFSKYKRVSLDVQLPEALPEGVLRYGIYENNRPLGLYPLGADMVGEGYIFNIKKNQQVRFSIAEEHGKRYQIN